MTSIAAIRSDVAYGSGWPSLMNSILSPVDFTVSHCAATSFASAAYDALVAGSFGSCFIASNALAMRPARSLSTLRYSVGGVYGRPASFM
jgi:hypothetical protein